MIGLAGIDFAYPGREKVLSGLDFVMEEGGRIALTGRNGCGKTTLLGVMMGLLKPDAGKISVFGKERREEKDFREVRPLMGFVFQDADDQLFCPTVADDLAFGPLNMGRSKAEADRISEEVLETLGLEGFGDRVTRDLSGGEKKLVALGTALALKPKTLILDEPTTFLDGKARERLLSLLNELNLPFLIVSHDFPFLKKTGCRLLELSEGKIRELDSFPDWD
ncbi:MAG: energy-coupling factor ABC transporter ATP-binding protein [Deltaproteobacteria bacterium]|nr:energy-coupling factor ABC transporter ATP-binding protein [Deltaproteobacteria bacterium]